MDEFFMQQAFQTATQPCLSFKVIKDKGTLQRAGYGFANFATTEAASKALVSLNGTVIPSSDPIVRFRLGWATYSSNPMMMSGLEEFSVYVGDLSPDVTDLQLLAFFQKRYPNLKYARIMYENGMSKGYGFLRFFDEQEYKHCLEVMNGMTGLGSRPIKVRAGTPKKPTSLYYYTSQYSSSMQSSINNQQTMSSLYSGSPYLPSYGSNQCSPYNYYYSGQFPSVPYLPSNYTQFNPSISEKCQQVDFSVPEDNKNYVSFNQEKFYESEKALWFNLNCTSSTK